MSFLTKWCYCLEIGYSIHRVSFNHNIHCLWTGDHIHRCPGDSLFVNRTSHPYVPPFNHMSYCLQGGHSIHWCHFLTMAFIVCKQDSPTLDALVQPHDLSLSWSDIPELVVPVKISERGLLLSRKLLNQGFSITSKVLLLPRWRNIFVAMYPGYATRIVSTSRFVPHSWLIVSFCN
jgi:hypothetical protein